MVLGEPGDRVAELVGQPCLLGHFAKYLRRRLVRFARPHQVEDPELHRLISTSACCPNRGCDMRRASKARTPL
jgi:hypothetical protein